MFSLLLTLLAGSLVAWAYWKTYDFFLSRYDFYRLSPFSYYFGKFAGSLFAFVFTAFFVFAASFEGEPPKEFDPDTYTCTKSGSENVCLKEKFDLLADSQLYAMTGNDISEVINRVKSDVGQCARVSTNAQDRDTCEIQVYERGIATLVRIADIGKPYYFEIEKCPDQYCKNEINEKVKAGYSAYAQERYNKWYTDNVQVDQTPEDEKKYQLGYEPSCRNGVPYVVCQDRRLLKLENKMNEMEPSVMHYDVPPYAYLAREYLKEELSKCGQDPNCYEHYYRLGIDSYSYIIEVGKTLRGEQSRCSNDQSCWDRVKQNAQIQVSSRLEFLPNPNRN